MIDLSNVTAEETCRMAAPAERVWDLLADLSLTPQIRLETLETEWVPPFSCWEVGAVFRAVNQRGDTRWEVECHVTVADRPQELGWTVLEPHHPSSTWWYRLDAIGHDTEVTVGFQHGPNISGLRMAIDQRPERADDIVANRIAEMRSNMRHTLERVRELAEARVT